MGLFGELKHDEHSLVLRMHGRVPFGSVSPPEATIEQAHPFWQDFSIASPARRQTMGVQNATALDVTEVQPKDEERGKGTIPEQQNYLPQVLMSNLQLDGGWVDAAFGMATQTAFVRFLGVDEPAVGDKDGGLAFAKRFGEPFQDEMVKAT